MSRKSNHQNNHVKSFKINDNNNRHRLGQNISFDDEFERQLNDVRNHRNQSFDSDHDNGHDIRYDADDQQMNTQQIIKRFILAFNGQLNQFNDKLKLFADQLQILSDSVNTIQLQSQYLTTNFQTFTSQCMNVLLLSSPSSTTTTSSSAAAATVSSSLMKLLQDSTIYLEDDLTNLSNTNQFVDSESESDHHHHHHHRNHNQKTNVSNKRISGNTNHNKFNSTTINRSTSIEQIRNEPSTSAIQDDYHNRDYRFVDSDDDDDDDGHDDQRMVNTGGTGKQSQNNPNRMNQRSNQRKFFRNHRCLNTTNDVADDGDQSIDDPFEFPVMTKQKRNQSRTTSKTTSKSTTSKPNVAGNSTKSLTTTAKQPNTKTLTKTSNKKNQNKKR